MEGRVEVYFNGDWGTVCGDKWFTSAGAAVVCRQLGYTGRSLVFHNAYFGEGSGLVLMHEVSCLGNESRLTDCDFRGWGSPCGHKDDIGVVCQEGQIILFQYKWSQSINDPKNYPAKPIFGFSR